VEVRAIEFRVVEFRAIETCPMGVDDRPVVVGPIASAKDAECRPGVDAEFLACRACG
jgi:hypothetical protein